MNWWYLVIGFLGFLFGFFVAALLSTAARADLEAQNALLKYQLEEAKNKLERIRDHYGLGGEKDESSN